METDANEKKSSPIETIGELSSEILEHITGGKDLKISTQSTPTTQEIYSQIITAFYKDCDD